MVITPSKCLVTENKVQTESTCATGTHIFSRLLLLKITIIVSLAMMMVGTRLYSQMILYGLESSVVVEKVPVVITPTCLGSIEHSTRPPLRILS